MTQKNVVENWRPFSVEGTLTIQNELSGGRIFFFLEDSFGDQILNLEASFRELTGGPIEPGSYTITLQLPPLWLAPQLYSGYFKFLAIGLHTHENRLLSERFLIDVHGGTPDGGSLSPAASWTVSVRKKEQQYPQ